FHAKSSVGARYFNALISSPSFEPIPLGDYLKRLVAVGLYSFEYATHVNRMPIRLHIPLGFYDEGDPEVPGSGHWNSFLNVDERGVVIINRSDAQHAEVLGKAFGTAFGTTVSRMPYSLHIYIDRYLLPTTLSQAGTGGFSVSLDSASGAPG